MNEFLSVFSVAFLHSLFAYSHMFDTTPSTCYDIDSVFALAVHIGFDGDSLVTAVLGCRAARTTAVQCIYCSWVERRM